MRLNDTDSPVGIKKNGMDFHRILRKAIQQATGKPYREE